MRVSTYIIPRLGEIWDPGGPADSEREGTPVIGQNRVSEPEGFSAG